MKDSHEIMKSTTETRSLIRRVDTDISPAPVVSYVEAEEDEGLPLREYWRAVYKHRWIIIGTTLLVTMLTAIHMARQPDIYESRARVQIDAENNPALSKNTSVGPDDATYLNTQLQILTSTRLLRRVAKTLNLEHNEAFFAPPGHSTWQNLLRMFGLGGKRRNNTQESVVEEVPIAASIAPDTPNNDLEETKRLAPYVGMLRAGLSVNQVKQNRSDTRLVDLSYTHRDPQIATKVVNAIADAFVSSSMDRRREANLNARTFLNKRIAELQGQITAGERQLISYAQSKEILTLEPGQNIAVDRLATLNRQLLEAENERKIAEAERDANSAPVAAEASALNNNAQIIGLEAELEKVRGEREELLVENTEEWPEVKEKTRRIAWLEKQIGNLRNRTVTNFQTDLTTKYRKSLAREQQLRSDYERQRGVTVTQNVAAIEYRIIEQQIATNKGLLDSLLQRSKEYDIEMAGLTNQPNNISVLDYALGPGGLAGPKRLPNVMMAFALSLVFGIGLALFLNYLDNSVRSADEVERLLHLPAIGAIPLVGSTARRRLLPAVSALGLQKRNGNGNGRGNGRPLLINEDARSPLAEAYRHLRTSVLMSVAGRAPKTILVTSSQPAEGKTTTVVNTAVVLAQTGANVLIIDADMRHPSLHSVFDLENEHGLSTYLSSGMSEDEASSMIEPTRESGVYLLSAGPTPPNPAELLGSEQMRRLLRFLESSYTYIIIDSPPIGYFTDSVVVSLMVDGVLLVVQSGHSSRDLVRRSRRVLNDVGAKIFGVVLNGVKEGSAHHDYYYSKNYY